MEKEECPVCFKVKSIQMTNRKYKHICSHFTCMSCLNMMVKDNICKCPICRSMITKRTRKILFLLPFNKETKVVRSSSMLEEEEIKPYNCEDTDEEENSGCCSKMRCETCGKSH